MSYQAKILKQEAYNNLDYTNEQSIAMMRLTNAAVINRVLTYTEGYNSDSFPITMATEGNGAVRTVKLNQVEFTWDLMGKPRYNDVIVKTTNAAQPGYRNQPFKVWFKTRNIIEQYGLIGPDGRSRVRVMGKPVKDQFGYCYTLNDKNPDPNSYIDPALFKVGQYWSMTIPTIPESYSRGNRAISMGPTKLKGQLGFHRFSKEIAGNAANTVVQYEFKTKSGGTTNLWINEEQRQFDELIRIMREEAYWMQRYNRLPNGEIVLKDEDNNNPIPESTGLFEICENNYDTYGENLYIEKIQRTIGDLLGRKGVKEGAEVVLYAGRGFRQDFTHAIEDKAVRSGYSQSLGDKFINGDSNTLVYGGTFVKYKTDDNYILTVKPLEFLDNGTLAELDRANGNLHPRTNLPMSSHQALMVDFSTYEGERNVKQVQMQGQEWLQGVYKGLTPTPPAWGVVPSNGLSTDVDASRYEIKTSSGLQVSNSERFMLLRSVLD